MKKKQPTPGPWKVERWGSSPTIAGARHNIMPPHFDPSKPKNEWPWSIATVYLSSPNCEPNLSLLLAAPELLEACREFCKWFDGWCATNNCCANSGLPVHEKALAAIAKAEATP